MAIFFNKKRQETIDEKKEQKNESDFISNNNINITVSNDNKNDLKQEKNIFKYLTIILSLILILLTIICCCFAISKKSYSKNENDNFITLTNKNYTNSKLIYDKFGKNNINKIKDYSLIGSKLFVSESKIVPESISSTLATRWTSNGNNFALYNLTNNTSEYHRTDFASEKFYIDLKNCEEGDYIIYNQNSTGQNISLTEINPYSISSENSINLIYYSLPNSNGQRKKIQIRNNKSTPFTIITVSNYGNNLPSNYYDGVISKEIFNYLNLEKNEINENELTTIENQISILNSKSIYKIKFVNSLEQIYSTNAIFSLSLSSTIDSDYKTSIYISKENSNLLSDTSLKNYDKNPEIREITGYLDCAGMSYYDVVGNNIISSSSSNHIGKEAYIIKINNILDLNTTISNFISSHF